MQKTFEKIIHLHNSIFFTLKLATNSKMQHHMDGRGDLEE